MGLPVSRKVDRRHSAGHDLGHYETSIRFSTSGMLSPQNGRGILYAASTIIVMFFRLFGFVGRSQFPIASVLNSRHTYPVSRTAEIVEIEPLWEG